MRIDFSVDGGLAAFPGLAKPVTIDCDALAPQEGERLRDLVRRADLFALPAGRRAPSLPDARAYTIAIDDGRQCRTVTLREPIADPALQELIAELAGHAATARRKA
ncbi:MAG TPA: protealysin inhibitor emfourin [Casimicrobiaceae bacterium]